MQEYSVYKKGEITVFLSLIFLAVISFISVVIYTSREIYIRQKVEAVSDIAIRSSFSEYNKKLYDKYGLLYVDSTYLGAESGGEDSFVYHVESYVDINLSEDANGIYGIDLQSIETHDVIYANQNHYASLVNQIKDYMIKSLGYSETMGDEEFLDSYIDLKMPEEFYERFVTIEEDYSADYEGEAVLINKYYEPSYDEKLSEVVMEIEKEIKDTTNPDFSFRNQIESAKISIFFEAYNGKIYECTRYYSLSM